MTGLILEPFGGIGGLSEAFALHGRTTLSIELEPWAVRMARANGHAGVQFDVVAYPYLLHRGQVEGIAGGPPCQGFSPAGKGDGHRDVPLILATAQAMFDQRDLGPEVGMAMLVALSKGAHDHRSHLVLIPWLWFLHLRPEWMLLEQVPRVLLLWNLLRDLARRDGCGAWSGKVCAEQYGVPQSRRRAALLIHRHRTDAQLVPVPTHSRYYEREPARLDSGVPRWVTMAEALQAGLTARPSFTVTGGGTAAGGAEPFGRRARAAMEEAQEAGEWVLRGGNQANSAVRDLDQPAPTLVLGGRVNAVDWVRTGQNSRQAGGEVIAYERATDLPAPTVTGNAGAWTLGDTRRKNGTVRDLDHPAPTILGTLDNGNMKWHQRSNFSAGSTEPGRTAAERGRTMRPLDQPSVTISGKPGHWVGDAERDSRTAKDAIRISPREAATLQSFRPDFELLGTLGQQFQGIGNAVPVLLGYALAARLL